MNSGSEKRFPSTEDLLRLAPVIPVLTIPDVTVAVPLAKALVGGGLPVLEVTLRTPAGLEAISAISEAVPEAIVGAGTVRSAEEFHQAASAGSRFIVSPGFSDSLLRCVGESGPPLLPGVATASELMRARDAGFRHVKFFPAEAAGGVATLKALGGPFPDMCFCPTGGVNLANLSQYLKLPSVLTVGGTWMTPSDLLMAENWEEIERIARETTERVKQLAAGA